MAWDTGVVYLLIVIAHLCSCARYVHYNEYRLESERICHLLSKKQTLDLRHSAAAIVTPHHMFDRWLVNADRHCTFIFRASKDEGLFAIIQKMVFRRNGNQCLDYVRFKRSDGYSTNKFCGEIDRQTMYPDLENNNGNDSRTLSYDMFAEYDPLKKLKLWNTEGAAIETEIFISKEKMPEGQSLDLILVYTPYKSCNQVDLDQYVLVGHNNCIRKEYICDKIHNCPIGLCSDEVNCVDGQYSKDDTATKVTVGAVTTMILCFIIFIMCLWICKKSQKLCWSSDCAGPNVCSPDADGGQGSNRAVSTAPMLEVAVSSPADKDLPPSYDSLFPERSNPARS